MDSGSRVEGEIIASGAEHIHDLAAGQMATLGDAGGAKAHRYYATG
jgi:hypothetical protein